MLLYLLVITIKTSNDIIKLNSDKGRETVSDYITALNGDAEAIKYAYDKRKAEYDTYDDELKVSVLIVFNVTEGEKVKDSVAKTVPTFSSYLN